MYKVVQKLRDGDQSADAAGTSDTTDAQAAVDSQNAEAAAAADPVNDASTATDETTGVAQLEATNESGAATAVVEAEPGTSIPGEANDEAMPDCQADPIGTEPTCPEPIDSDAGNCDSDLESNPDSDDRSVATQADDEPATDPTAAQNPADTKDASLDTWSADVDAEAEALFDEFERAAAAGTQAGETNSFSADTPSAVPDTAPDQRRSDADRDAGSEVMFATTTEAATGASQFVVERPSIRHGAVPVVVHETAPWDLKRVDETVVAFHTRYSSICEQYRSVRARLLNMNTSRAHQVIAITSALPQEGKSVTTMNLGIVMAEGGEHDVLICDVDFRRASIARMLGIDLKPGLADLIRNEATLEEVIRPTPFPNLKIITAGAVGAKSYGELLSTPSTRDILARVRDGFDYSILDTPPVNTVSDVSTLAPLCDGVVLVIEMRRTPEPNVQEAIRTLQTTNVKILGCVLSRYRDRRGHYYDRYYSYYSSRES